MPTELMVINRYGNQIGSPGRSWYSAKSSAESISQSIVPGFEEGIVAVETKKNLTVVKHDDEITENRSVYWFHTIKHRLVPIWEDIHMAPIGVRTWVALDKRSDPRSLTILASDQVSSIVGAVVSNPRTPPEVLDKIADNEDVVHMYALLSHPHVLAQTLWKIRMWSSKHRSEGPLSEINMSLNLSKRDNIEPWMAEILSRHEESRVREAIAKNAGKDPLDERHGPSRGVLEKLAKDKSSTVRNVAKKNPRLKV